MEGFRDLPNLPFLEKWVKRINILKKKATENGIDLKEYTPRFVCRLAVKLAKATVEFESNVANDLIYRFRPMKPVLPQDSRIFRIYIPMNFEILFLEAYLFQICKVLKEYALEMSGKNTVSSLIYSDRTCEIFFCNLKVPRVTDRQNGTGQCCSSSLTFNPSPGQRAAPY